MNLYNLFVGEDRYSGHDHDYFSKVLDSKINFIFVKEKDRLLIGFIAFSIRNAIRYPRPILENRAF